MLKPYYHFYLIATLLLATTVAYAQTDTINFSNRRLNTAYLTPGLKQYLVYTQNPLRHKTLGLGYWVRDVQVQTRQHKKVFVIQQHWYGNDTLNYRTVTSVNQADNFAPIYHAETVKGITKAYNWNAASMSGADTVMNNAAKSFSLNFKVPNFNWNLDMETFEMLPLAAGKTFAINFYDAGIGTPEYVIYQVQGSEPLILLDNQKVDCWKLFYEGKMPNGAPYTQTFWISKKSHEMLKEEDVAGGLIRYKIKLPGTTPDIVSRFK
ncbi:hypothetical protein HH214_07875 [Mucilaginibacter robiniae]|uniref:DUF3108 domain-containing protein n=1 Tax=Mucilaginibacter robiniae TaxID=2728022 RepID=A0A7L5E2E9_9SPHI|nr:hypothetical protein [Mucilaginibacter robiniae]QJD95794.1 hypothetical protein HH214_07875 [Mucilaginibacter robiniae]